jgi:hypothetical protein
MPAKLKPIASAKNDSTVSGDKLGTATNMRALPRQQAIAEDAARRYEMIKERLMTVI